MKLTSEETAEHLEKAYQQMMSDGFKPGLIAHVGKTTAHIGKFFADKFGCKAVYLPSLKTGMISKDLSNLLDSAYKHLPEKMLKFTFSIYACFYKSFNRKIPAKAPLDEIIRHADGLPVLIVDDNTFTGKTLETWKSEVHKAGKDAATFAITKTGNYDPDYYCLNGWHSFDWAPLGM